MAREMVRCFTPPRLFLLVWPVQKEQERDTAGVPIGTADDH